MRVHLTDGTRKIDIRAPGATLADVEATARRLLDALPPTPNTPPGDDTPTPEHTPFGFTLDGTSLSADTERADQEQLAETQHPDPHRPEPDEDDEP
ncbi:hypothetical protein [Streptomyces sp. NPDC059165]|uniref:hypothetical protein n=1 Tax=Streptomyces sp. NPDC059165 TaxID=3346751 RepID=UPI0036B2057E